MGHTESLRGVRGPDAEVRTQGPLSRGTLGPICSTTVCCSSYRLSGGMFLAPAPFSPVSVSLLSKPGSSLHVSSLL